jgi:hypothetical protein
MSAPCLIIQFSDWSRRGEGGADPSKVVLKEKINAKFLKNYYYY